MATIEQMITEINQLGYTVNIWEYSTKYLNSSASRDASNRWDCTAYAEGRMDHFGFGASAHEAVEKCLHKSRDIKAGKYVQKKGLIQKPAPKSDPFGEDVEEDAFE